MFSVGLEFSLPKLVTMRGAVFGLGAAQVIVTTMLVAALCLALGLGWRAGLILGGALAMSSTAILAKMLAERLELNSQHGRAVIGVLAVPGPRGRAFLDLDPGARAKSGRHGPPDDDRAVESGVVLSLVLFVGQRLMRPWFHLVARQKSPELFMLNLLLFTLGLAWVTGQAGLSLALGAFLAGMLISETEYRYQVEQDIRPFQDVLMGLFFVTIGMQLDLGEVALNLPAVGAVLAWLAVVQVRDYRRTQAGCSAAILGRRLRTGLRALRGRRVRPGASVAGFELNLLSKQVVQVVLAAMILSMLVAPFIIEKSERIVRRWSSGDWMYRAMALAQHRCANAGHGTARHHLRLWAGPDNILLGCWSRKTSRPLRSMSTPSAFARPRQPVKAWYSATPLGARY